MRIEAKNLYRL